MATSSKKRTASPSHPPLWLVEGLDIVGRKRWILGAVVLGVVALSALAALLFPDTIPATAGVGAAVGVAALLLGLAAAVASDATELIVRGPRHVAAAGGELVAVVPRDPTVALAGPLAAAIEEVREPGAPLLLAFATAGRDARRTVAWTNAIARSLVGRDLGVLRVDLASGRSDEPGLVEVVRDGTRLADVVEFEPGVKLANLRAGRDHGEALDALTELPSRLPRDLDMLLVSLPTAVSRPVVTAAAALDHVLVVVERDRTSRVDLIASLDALEAAGTNAQVVLLDTSTALRLAPPVEVDPAAEGSTRTIASTVGTSPKVATGTDDEPVEVADEPFEHDDAAPQLEEDDGSPEDETAGSGPLAEEPGAELAEPVLLSEEPGAALVEPVLLSEEPGAALPREEPEAVGEPQAEPDGEDPALAEPQLLGVHDEELPDPVEAELVEGHEGEEPGVLELEEELGAPVEHDPGSVDQEDPGALDAEDAPAAGDDAEAVEAGDPAPAAAAFDDADRPEPTEDLAAPPPETDEAPGAPAGHELEEGAPRRDVDLLDAAAAATAINITEAEQEPLDERFPVVADDADDAEPVPEELPLPQEEPRVESAVELTPQPEAAVPDEADAHDLPAAPETPTEPAAPTEPETATEPAAPTEPETATEPAADDTQVIPVVGQETHGKSSAEDDTDRIPRLDASGGQPWLDRADPDAEDMLRTTAQLAMLTQDLDLRDAPDSGDAPDPGDDTRNDRAALGDNPATAAVDTRSAASRARDLVREVAAEVDGGPTDAPASARSSEGRDTGDGSRRGKDIPDGGDEAG